MLAVCKRNRSDLILKLDLSDQRLHLIPNLDEALLVCSHNHIQVLADIDRHDWVIMFVVSDRVILCN